MKEFQLLFNELQPNQNGVLIIQNSKIWKKNFLYHLKYVAGSRDLSTFAPGVISDTGLNALINLISTITSAQLVEQLVQLELYDYSFWNDFQNMSHDVEVTLASDKSNPLSALTVLDQKINLVKSSATYSCAQKRILLSTFYLG
jgi:hypothetical protein